jgi:hypothetical protein
MAILGYTASRLIANPTVPPEECLESGPLGFHLTSGLILQYLTIMWALYTLLMSVCVGTRFVSLMVGGMQVPSFMRYPWMAISLREFWSDRWNLAVRDVLKKFVFVPFIQMFPSQVSLATIFTFLGSALLHIVPAWVGGADAFTLWYYSAYFISQLLLIILEKLVTRHLLNPLPLIVRRVYIVVFVMTPAYYIFTKIVCRAVDVQ